MKKYTHDELVLKACSWLRGKEQCRVVLAEVTGVGETPDAIGFGSSGVSTLVECKTSRSDFLADLRSKKRIFESGLGLYRYYLCPPGIIKVEDLPNKWVVGQFEKRVLQGEKRERFFSRRGG